MISSHKQLIEYWHDWITLLAEGEDCDFRITFRINKQEMNAFQH